MKKSKKDGKLFEYEMSEEYAQLILARRKREKSKLEPQPYLCKWVNDHCGMMGTCVYVHY